MEFEKARAIVEELKGDLEEACERVEVVGEIRRRKPSVRGSEVLRSSGAMIRCRPESIQLKPVNPRQGASTGV